MSDTITKQVLIDEFTNSGHNCVKSFYTVDNNWYDWRTEILTPSHCIKKQLNGDSYIEYNTSETRSEFSILLLLTVIFTLLLLIWINYKSHNPYYLGWFKVNLIYIIATFSIIVFFQINAETPGFTRLNSFGVLVHNTAEAYLIKYLWYGRRGNGLKNTIFGVIYMWIVTVVMVFVDMNALYFLIMLQGASLDFFLVYSFPVISRRLKAKGLKYNKCTYIIGNAAAVIHIISIQPLFFGMGLGRGSLYGMTALFLFPTFFLYTIFASRELGRISFGGPTFVDTIRYIIMKDRLKRALGIKSKVRRATTVANKIEKVAMSGMSSVKSQYDVTVQDDTSDFRVLSPPFGDDIIARDTTDRRFSAAFQTQSHNEKFFLGRDKLSSQMSVNLVENGAMYALWGTDAPIPDWRKAKAYWGCVIAAFVTSFINSMIVFYAPCFVRASCDE